MIPHIARYFFREVSTPPKWCDIPPWYLVSHRHICAIPHCATYRAIIVRYPTKTSTKEFCDTIAASIARHEKYRYWSSKPSGTEKATVFESVVFCYCHRLFYLCCFPILFPQAMSISEHFPYCFATTVANLCSHCEFTLCPLGFGTTHQKMSPQFFSGECLL